MIHQFSAAVIYQMSSIPESVGAHLASHFGGLDIVVECDVLHGNGLCSRRISIGGRIGGQEGLGFFLVSNALSEDGQSLLLLKKRNKRMLKCRFF